MEIVTTPSITYLLHREFTIHLSVYNRSGSNMSGEGYDGKVFFASIERKGFVKARLEGYLNRTKPREMYELFYGAIMPIIKEEFNADFRTAVECFCDKIVTDIKTLATIL
ncbi:hypothetical protein PS2_068 [Serratia phage PS2]|uniref:Uncharacterized protein n=1 Tax=Serratia phage PS2 TaxID=1481112 RepID=A0A023W4Z1_9CAUD|nr:hypothetical protein FF83_gp068 [Serratia phage PS2]AHY25315.1 hypothetical protein PS2_068 [Serratia phage PS2]